MNRCPECLGNFYKRVQRDIHVAPFDFAYEIVMQSCLLSQLLLGEASRNPASTKSSTNDTAMRKAIQHF